MSATIISQERIAALRLLHPQGADFEFISLEPGFGWRRGPPCLVCEHSKGTAITGAHVILNPEPEDLDKSPCDVPGCQGHEVCAFCRAAIQLHGQYGERQTGKVRILFPPETDGIQENPYLNPRGVRGEPVDEWFTLPLTDVGNGKRMVMLHGHGIRYVKQWGWMIYDGRRWIHDDIGCIERLAKHTVEELSRSIERATVLDKKSAKEFEDFAKSSGSAGKISAMIDMASSEPEIAMRVADFDVHSWLLTCKNGLVDLTTGALRPHDPMLYMTQMVNCEYDPEATCPRFDSFMMEVMLNNELMVQFLQRAVGYSMTGDTKEQCVFFLYGDGANGKSRFLEAIRFLMGDYAAHMPFEAFVMSRNSKPEQALASLPGKRFVTAIEVGEGRSWNEGMIKAISGGDMLVAEKKYKDAFEFKPVAKFWLAANDRPVVNGSNEGIWRRFRMIPFQAYFAPKDRQDDLEQQLQDERAGILSWAVRGAMLWRRHKLSPPALVTEALEEYKTDNDILARFIQERCTIEKDGEVQASVLLKEYNLFAKESSERSLTHMALSLRVAKFRAGLLKKGRNGKGQTTWNGLRIAIYHSEERQDELHRNDLSRY